MSTFAFIRKNKFNNTFRISQILINDSQDLIRKATGWMLREIGKRSEKELCRFLDKHSGIMPRTMLGMQLKGLIMKKSFYMSTPKP